jgi:repressor LexA
MALTRRQKQVLDFIAGFVEQNGYSPSYDEIAQGLSLASLATVHKHISALEAKHYLKRAFNQSRSLDLAPKYFQELRRHREQFGTEVPLVGRIAAGRPIEAIEDREVLDLEELFVKPSEMFVLRVRGDSMVEDHIRDGDFVVCEKRPTARDGETVVALLDEGEATLKRFYREKDGVRLQPANPKYEPIRTRNVTIQGVVVGVVRKY